MSPNSFSQILLKSIAFSLILLTIGCAPTRFVRIDGIISKQEDQTNEKLKGNSFISIEQIKNKLTPRIIDKAINNLEFDDRFLNTMSKTDKIIIMPLDRKIDSYSFSDEQQVVERGLLKLLLEKGYSIYDRNSNVILRLLSDTFNDFYSKSNRDSVLSRNKALFPVSDIVLGYQILELGVINIEDKSKKTVNRLATVIIEMRIIDAKSLRVLNSDIVYGTFEDEIELKLQNVISEFHFGFTTDALPLVKGNSLVKNLTKDPSGLSSNSKTITTGYSKQSGIKIVFEIGNSTNGVFEIYSKKTGLAIHRIKIPDGLTGFFNYEWNCTDDKGNVVENGEYVIINNTSTGETIQLNTFSIVD